jgi:hypothetical protein
MHVFDSSLFLLIRTPFGGAQRHPTPFQRMKNTFSPTKVFPWSAFVSSFFRLGWPEII